MTEDEQLIAEETVIEQRIIPFEGDDLAAAQSEAGEIYVSIPGMCAALGLNARGQIQRIQRAKSLAKGLRRIRLKTPTRGSQTINCLRLDRIALWIAGIETDRINPKYQAKIEAYQDELAPVAMRVFMRMLGVSTVSPAPADPRMAALAEQYDVLMSAATLINEHMEDLARLPGQVAGVADQLAQAMQLLESLAAQQATTATIVQQIKQEQRLSPAQKQHIKEAVNRIVDDSAGKPGEMKHSSIYIALYRRFGVSTYAEIPTARYEEVMNYLRDLWKQATTGTNSEQKSLF